MQLAEWLCVPLLTQIALSNKLSEIALNATIFNDNDNNDDSIASIIIDFALSFSLSTTPANFEFKQYTDYSSHFGFN